MSENMKNKNTLEVVKTDHTDSVEVPLIELEMARAIAPKKRGRPAKVEKEIFIEMWNKSTSLDEVSGLLNISKSSCSVRASNLRKQGNELILFRRGRKLGSKMDQGKFGSGLKASLAFVEESAV
jgi:hypothetical protein